MRRGKKAYSVRIKMNSSKNNLMKSSRKKRKRIIYFISFVAGLVVLRVCAPIFLEYKIISSINETDNYHIQIDDVDLAILRGGMCIQNVILTELNSANPEIPFVTLNNLDFNIEWKSLFKGHLVGELYVDSINMNLVIRPDSLVSDSLDDRFVLADLLLGLNPLSINHAELNYGKACYKDPTAIPPIDITLDHINLYAENLNNVDVKLDSLPGEISLNATTSDSIASLAIDSRVNLLKDIPDIDLEFELKDYQLTELNALLQNTANFDLNKGTLSIFSEASVKDSMLIGYVKPFLEDLDFVSPEEKGNFFNKAYEGILEFGSKILRNKKTEKIATKVPFEGNVRSSDPEEWTAVFNTLKNAFFTAFTEEVDHSIDYYEQNK